MVADNWFCGLILKNQFNFSYDPNRFTPEVIRALPDSSEVKQLIRSSLQQICYSFYIPPGASAMGAQVTPTTILIVDDEETIRTTLALILEDEGYHCLLAADATTALEIIEEKHIDLLITDLCLPHVDGLQLLNLFQKRLPDTLVIVITNYSDAETAERAIGLGAAEYLLKPIDFNKLISRVRYHLKLN